ncbi:E3 ubiquitin-protein ligase TRIM58-like isoform X2 [Engraulis encrasicolus]|uniref:E3 ubiquitin-protein ligase TRIM58-like isoform X2 n=1 Tax=Engraulis encrasicolus TaxID=184585 RepID=UPI002FD66C3D
MFFALLRGTYKLTALASPLSPVSRREFILCPVCLSDFVDPVSLPCQHSYCRQCITGHANVSLGPSQCPECRQPFSMADIRPNRDLRNIIESIRKAHASSTGRESPKGDLMCEEHDEKRKLFCETDQKLICVICKEQEKHQGHTFAPVKEASEKSKWWQEIDFAGTEDKKEEQDGQTKPEEVDACGRYRSQAKDLVVIRDCLSMGPYETHMAYCVWREVLQKIQPGPARVSIKDLGDSFLRCSPDGHSIRRRTRSGFIHKNYNPSSSTNQTFQTGRHYCELEVGGKTDWSIGVKAESTKGSPLHLPEKEIQLHLKKGDFVFTHDGVESPVSDLNTDKPPRRIGLYLDCDGQQVSFYDADTMTLIASSFCSFLQPCSISVCPGLYMEGKNRDPLTFYWH